MQNNTNESSLINEIEKQANDAAGPTKYMIRAMKPLITSNFLAIRASKQVQEAVEKFEKNANDSQKSATVITVVGLIVAVAQLILAYITWKFRP